MNELEINARLKDANEAGQLMSAMLLILSGAQPQNKEKCNELMNGLTVALEGLPIVDKSFVLLTLFSLAAGELVGRIERPPKMPEVIWNVIERAQKTVKGVHAEETQRAILPNEKSN